MKSSDFELVDQVRQGDRRAFGDIVTRYHAPLLGVARAYSRNRDADDADDAVQNALVLAFLHLGQLRDTNRLGPWLRQMTVNACRQQARAHKPTVSLEAVPEAAEDDMPTTDTRLLLEQALSCLSPETRLTVMLYYQREMSLPEIAAFQEVPTTTIKSRLRHARARLRKEMEQLLEPLLEETIAKEMTTETPNGSDADPGDSGDGSFAPRLLRRLEAAGDIGFTVFSPDGSRLITLAWLEVTETTFRSALCCFESQTGKPLWSLPHESWMFSPQYLPGDSKSRGSRVAVCAGLPGQRGGAGQLLLLDTDTGAVVQVIADTPAAKSI
ncbi:MAG: sigma-70 family RNA polymerase sigma factor, partial [Armatimonadota bacterium]